MSTTRQRKTPPGRQARKGSSEESDDDVESSSTSKRAKGDGGRGQKGGGGGRRTETNKDSRGKTVSDRGTGGNVQDGKNSKGKKLKSVDAIVEANNAKQAKIRLNPMDSSTSTQDIDQRLTTVDREGLSDCLLEILCFFAAPAHPHATSARVYDLVNHSPLFADRVGAQAPRVKLRSRIADIPEPFPPTTLPASSPGVGGSQQSSDPENTIPKTSKGDNHMQHSSFSRHSPSPEDTDLPRQSESTAEETPPATPNVLTPANMISLGIDETTHQDSEQRKEKDDEAEEDEDKGLQDNNEEIYRPLHEAKDDDSENDEEVNFVVGKDHATPPVVPFDVLTKCIGNKEKLIHHIPSSEPACSSSNAEGEKELSVDAELGVQLEKRRNESGRCAKDTVLCVLCT